MKTNLKLDVADAQRNALACLLAGKQVKRLASREEVGEFVQGALAGLERIGTMIPASGPKVADFPAAVERAARGAGEATPEVEAMRVAYRPEEAREVARLLAEGRSEGYVRGWVYAGRKLRGQERRA